MAARVDCQEVLHETVTMKSVWATANHIHSKITSATFLGGILLPARTETARTTPLSLFIEMGLLVLLFASVLLGAGIAPLIADDNQTNWIVHLRDGKQTQAKLVASETTIVEVRAESTGKLIPVESIVDFVNSKSDRYFQPRGQFLTVHLAGGEWYPVVSAHVQPDILVLTPQNADQRHSLSRSVPLSLVDAIRQPLGITMSAWDGGDEGTGERYGFTDDLRNTLSIEATDEAEDRSCFALSGGESCTIYEANGDPLIHGMTFDWLSEKSDPKEVPHWTMVFTFGEGVATDELTLTMNNIAHVAVGGKWAVECNDCEMSANRNGLRLDINETRTVVLLNQTVIASGAAPTQPLKRIRIEHKQQPVQKSKVWIDNLRLFRKQPTNFIARYPALQPTVWLPGGDEVYPSSTALSDGMELNRLIHWKHTTGYLPGKRVEPALPAVKGLICLVQFVPAFDEPGNAAAEFVAAWDGIEGNKWLFSHPLLGKLHVAPSDVKSLRPLYRGIYRPLQMQIMHLGNNRRPDWRVPDPSATELIWNGPPIKSPVAAARHFIRLRVVELEPFGGRFANQGRFLDDLRAGGLKSMLWVNGHQIGDLNSYLDTPASESHPQSLRIPIPSEHIGDALRSLRISQNPSSKNRDEFDDWEVDRVVWEIEE